MFLKLTHFYGRKFIANARNKEQEQYVENNIDILVKSKFFQGYFVMKSMLLDSETNFPEEVWTLNKGIIRNELPILIESIFNTNNEEWYRTEQGQSIGMKLVQLFDVSIFDLVRQTRKDIALYGAYKAFIEDERFQNITTQETNYYFGDPFELVFINPQVYMQAQFLTNEQEIWDFIYKASMRNKSWIGTIQLSEIPDTQGQKFFLLQLTISETVLRDEKYEILNNLLSVLPENIRSVLQTRIYHVNEIEVLVPAEN